MAADMVAGYLLRALLVNHLGFDLREVAHVELVPPGDLLVSTVARNPDGTVMVRRDEVVYREHVVRVEWLSVRPPHKDDT